MAASTTDPYVGRRIHRIEDSRLLTGTGFFVADAIRRNSVYARFVRSPVAHGILKRIDVDAAREHPGVRAVVTADDLPELTVPVRLLPTEISDQVQQPVLARDRVRYVGEPLAIVLAEDPYTAEDAAEAVIVEVEPLAPALDTLGALAPESPILHEALGANTADSAQMSHGEPLEGLFEQADVHLSGSFSVQRHGAVPMETRGLVAEYDERNDRLTVWGPAKVKHFNRSILARMIEMPEDRIRFFECDVGGGFGARGEFYPEDFLIPWLARELRRPVRWIEDRHESLTTMNQSREQVWQYEVAARSDGTLLGFRATAHFNQGAYARTHGTVLLPKIMLNHIAGPYRWRGFEATATSVMTNKTPAGTYRGPCQYESTFVRERMLDRIAAELDLDPAELRAKNLIAPEDLPYDTGLPAYVGDSTITIEEGDYPRVWRELLERADYQALRRQVEERRASGERVGIGLATFTEIGAPGAFEQARVIAEPDGSFTVHTGISSVGQGVETALAQIAADGLGVDISRISVSYKDTDLIPEGLGAFSSRTTLFGGNAVAGAVKALRENARQALAAKHRVAIDAVEWEGGAVKLAGRRVTAAELEAEAEYRYQPAPGSHVVMGANLAVTRIDPMTANVIVERFFVAYDVGRVINPLTLEGQILGGVVQGIGGALLEEFAYDDQGQPLSTTFMDYRIPTAVEAPDEIEVSLLELGAPNERNPLAAKGGAEGGIVGVGGAVANAVADALGQPGDDISALPIRPEVINERL